MNIVMKKVSSLQEYENNPRNNDAAIDAVAKSIEEFGFKVPIVITKDHVIIAGHTRLKASLKLGLDEVLKPLIGEDLSHIQVLINPTSAFVVGGPYGDSGLTGRKIIVDTYGGYAKHGDAHSLART